MQYNASRGPTAMTAPAVKTLNIGARSASHTYGVDTPPRTASTDSDMPGWANMPLPRPGGGPPSAFAGNKDIVRHSARHSRSRSDVVSRHLLVETALLDSQNFELLTIQEVDMLKKERTQLEAKLETTRRKLAMESKVRDAAQSLHRLYTDDNKGISLAAPQAKARKSFQMPFGGNQAQKHVGQAVDELQESQKKVDDLLQILSGLESRRQYVESRLLRHTAAVLQQDHEVRARSTSRADTPSESVEDDYDQNLIDNTISGLLNGAAYDERLLSKELHKRSASQGSFRGSGKRQSSAQRVSDQRLVALQSRIDGMNSQMRNMIQIVRGDQPSSDDESDVHEPRRSVDPVAYLETQIEVVDKNLRRLEEECQRARSDRDNIMSHIGETSKQLHSLVQMSYQGAEDFELLEPPSPQANDMEPVLDYLDEATLALQDALQGHIEKATQGSEEDRQRADQYENTVEGLWEIITSQSEEQEPFSLPAFSTRIQHMFDKAANMDVQTDILRRQIQQQRELNSKSDSEKEKQVEEANTARAQAEAELEELRELHAAAELEAQELRGELEKVMEEFEQIRLATEANEQQKQAVLEQLTDHKTRAAELEATIAEYDNQISELQDDLRLTAAEAEGHAKEHEERMQDLNQQLTTTRAAHDETRSQLDAKHQESANMEAEMIRLTTELTMVKAELDAAYGSRAERAKESTNAELESLRKERDAQAVQLSQLTNQVAELKSGGSRAAELERELRDMARDMADLTADSVAAEREREQLESLAESLKARCETLEAHLMDERVRSLGMKSPSVASGGEGQRDQTSAMVLRNEFKKMMRETRAENAKALRAEQEERKKLEAMIRTLKKEKEGGSGGLTVKA